MSTPPKPVPIVQGILRASPGKRVLLVEGPNDKAVYEAWLKKLAYPNLVTARVVVEAVEGKRAVLTALEWFRDYGGNPGHLFGLVDRDEWDAAIVTTQTAALPQLRLVAGRDCLESYFADPDELEPSLQAEDAAYAAQLPAFRTRLENALPARVAHWALFTTTERLKERMNAAIYPGAFHATIPIPPDADIQNRFQTWAGLVAHPQLFNELDGLRAQALGAVPASQFRSHVSAKLFFDHVVYPAPEGLRRFRAKPDSTWRLDLAENAPTAPADIAAILQPLLQ
jgi:hypothetical protein